LVVAFIDVAGARVELMSIDRAVYQGSI